MQLKPRTQPVKHVGENRHGLLLGRNSLAQSSAVPTIR